MFVFEPTSNDKGNIAEAAVVFHAARAGIPVFRPLTEHGRTDLVLDDGRRLLRVQCKWASRDGEIVVVRLTNTRRSASGYVRTTYAKGEIDAVAAYCAETDACYLLPIDLVAGMRQISLRLAPARNGQIASVHFAADYRLGAVAQLGERRHGMAEVRGSSPLSSIDAPEGTVSAHAFRERFGWFMQRAAQGETVTVTRRGRPFVRLGPAGPSRDCEFSAETPPPPD